MISFKAIFKLAFQSLKRPKEAFVDSETETEFTEVTLSPPNNDVEPTSGSSRACSSRLFHKRQSPSSVSSQFHSLPPNSMKATGSSFGQVSSWEANNLMEEMTTGNSHMQIQYVSNTGKMELDSLINGDMMIPEADEDSLNFDLQQVEDSLTPDDDEEHYDSLQPSKSKKKLIIPYNESFSSSNSIFTTSQEGSMESGGGKNKQREEEQEDSLTLNMMPLGPNWQQYPKILGPEYQPAATLQDQATPQPIQASQLQTSHSLMKMATERMKRKFLGWN